MFPAFIRRYVDRRSKVLFPSGDETGATDDAVLSARGAIAEETILAEGDWYIGAPGITADGARFRGRGPATHMHVVSGGNGWTFNNNSDNALLDMLIDGGDYAITVNGANDALFQDLQIKNQALGGVVIDGDLATEQHWRHVVGRNIAGWAFDVQRTTSIYTGSLYLDQVRFATPATGASGGFRFRSTAGSQSLNIAFMLQCVADAYDQDGLLADNVAQLFIAQSWFAIGDGGSAGSAAVRILDPLMVNMEGCYTYTGLDDPSVLVEGDARQLSISAGHVFDGEPATVALGLSGVTSGALRLGEYVKQSGGAITDTPYRLVQSQTSLPGITAKSGQEIFSRMLCTSNGQLSSGTLLLSYFTATNTEEVSAVECMTNTAASGTTYAGVGLYTVDNDGLLTLVAKGEQTSSPTWWGSAYQPVGGFDTEMPLSGTYELVAGQRYAVGVLFVGTTGPRLIAANPSSGTPQSNLEVSGTPLGPLAATKGSQTEIGTVDSTTHTAASLSGSGPMPYYVLK